MSNVKAHQMQQFSYAKALLQHWGVAVEDIFTSDAEQKQEADFLASFGDVRVLIEEKTKEDDPIYLAKRIPHGADGTAFRHRRHCYSAGSFACLLDVA